MTATDHATCRCYLCGKPWTPKYAADVICWTCIIRRAA